MKVTVTARFYDESFLITPAHRSEVGVNKDDGQLYIETYDEEDRPLSVVPMRNIQYITYKYED